MAWDALQRGLRPHHCGAAGGCFCGQPDGCTADAEPCGLPVHGAAALRLHHAGLQHERPCLERCQAYPPQQNLRKAHPPRRGLQRDRRHQRGGHAGQRGRGADRYLLRKIPAPTVLQSAGPGDPLRSAGGGPRAVGHHPAVLRAPHPYVHRGGAEVRQEAAGEVLGRVHYPRRQLSGEHPRPDHPENLSGRRLEARGDEPTGRALPEDHHEGADHAAELRHPDGSDGLRRRGSGHHQRGGGLCQGADHFDCGADHPPAGGGLLPAAASAGQLLPHRHERRGFGREDLQAPRCGRACRRHQGSRGGHHPPAGARDLRLREGPHHPPRHLPDRPAGQLRLAGGGVRLRQEHHCSHPLRCPHRLYRQRDAGRRARAGAE